jgi:peptidoglycan/xylan/chitin deacetylase (PgdA/CDA1 family)
MDHVWCQPICDTNRRKALMAGGGKEGYVGAMLKRRSLLRIAATATGAALSGCDSGPGAPATGATAPATASVTAPVPGTSSAGPAARPGSGGRPPPPPEVVNGPRDKAMVALTFHGQGEAASVQQILGELANGGAKATVLAVGSWLAAQPDMAKLVLDGGHELGNHTQNHLAIAALKPDEALAEIQGCAQLLKKLTGSIGTWFRPSQTRLANDMIKAQATAAGYETCLSYDLDSLDYTDPGSAAVVRNVLDGVQNGSIISLHFGHEGTVSAIPKILDGLYRKALRPVTMTELVS